MYIVSERKDGVTSKTPFTDKEKAEVLIKKLNAIEVVAILLEVGSK
jgi:hypothetical protein